MDEKAFRDMDKAWMERTRAERERPVTDAEFFAGQVERRIREKRAVSRAPRLVPFLVPALALSLLLAVPVVRRGGERVQLAAVTAEASIGDEIALLKELGAWTEEDDAEAGTEEAVAIELSSAPAATRLA